MDAGKIAAFYKEFPFLKKVAWRFTVGNITVSRVTRELVAEPGKFFLFDHSGQFLGKSRFWENLEDAILRVGGQDRVAFVVGRKFPRPGGSYYSGSFTCPEWLLFLSEGYVITVYKPPKDFKIEDLKRERAALVAWEVRREVDKT